MPFQVVIAGCLFKLDPTMSALRKPKKTKRGPIEVTSSVVVVQVQNGRRCATEYRLDKTLMTQQSQPEAAEPRSEISMEDNADSMEFDGPTEADTEVVVSTQRKTKVSIVSLWSPYLTAL